MIDSETIRKTFCEEAIRTVMLIDDEFPTYAELREVKQAETELAGDPSADQALATMNSLDVPVTASSDRDFERAKALYDAFKERKLLCDIENDPTRLKGEHIERIRKSDLIILDFNLQGSSPNSTDSIALLNALADSTHFNLVIVYTRQQLDLVWLKVAASLRGGWMAAKQKLEADENVDTYRDRFHDMHPGYMVPQELMIDYILRGNKAFKENYGEALRSDVKSAQIHPKVQTTFMEALIASEVEKLDIDTTAKQRTVSGEFLNGEIRWIHCGTVFITFIHKEADKLDDAENMYDHLVDALVAWKPNVLQVFLSQIQNILELKALAYDKRVFESEELQAGWIYHALTELLEKKESKSEGVRRVVERLYARVLDTISSNLVHEHNACEEGIKLFMKYLEGQKPGEDFESRVDQAIKLSRSTKALNSHNVLHALNSYLSTEPFREDHVTNGTIFFEKRPDGKEDWWVCASPACDMIPRPLKDSFNLYHSLAPHIPMTALRLEPGKPESMTTATQGRSVFVNYGDKQKYFHAFNTLTYQPRSAYFMLTGAAPTQDHEFDAYALTISSDKTISFTPKRFTAVAQLRPDYASRLLQQVGHHSSRIGVDFVDFVPPDINATPTELGADNYSI